MALNDREKNLLITALRAENIVLWCKNEELHSVCESLKCANAEKDQVLSKLMDNWCEGTA